MTEAALAVKAALAVDATLAVDAALEMQMVLKVAHVGMIGKADHCELHVDAQLNARLLCDGGGAPGRGCRVRRRGSRQAEAICIACRKLCLSRQTAVAPGNLGPVCARKYMWGGRPSSSHVLTPSSVWWCLSIFSAHTPGEKETMSGSGVDEVDKVRMMHAFHICACGIPAPMLWLHAASTCRVHRTNEGKLPSLIPMRSSQVALG